MPFWTSLIVTVTILIVWVLHVIYTRTTPRTRSSQQVQPRPSHQHKSDSSRRVSFSLGLQEAKRNTSGADSASNRSSLSSSASSASGSSRSSSKRLYLWRLRTHDLAGMTCPTTPTVDVPETKQSHQSSIRATLRRMSNSKPFSPRLCTSSSSSIIGSPIEKATLPLSSHRSRPLSIHAVMCDTNADATHKNSPRALDWAIHAFKPHRRARSLSHQCKTPVESVDVPTTISSPQPLRVRHKLPHIITNLVHHTHERSHSTTPCKRASWDTSGEPSPYLVASPLPLSFVQDTDSLVAAVSYRLSEYTSEERQRYTQPSGLLSAGC